MNYKSELEFFKKILKNLQLPAKVLHTFSDDMSTFDLTDIDLGLRRLVLAKQVEDIQKQFEQLYKPNTIYRIHDEYLCNYILFLLPETDTPEYFLIGPYTLTEIKPQDVLRIAEKSHVTASHFPQLKKYYESLTLLPNESRFLALLNTFGEHIWGNMGNFSLQDNGQFLSETDISKDDICEYENLTHENSITFSTEFENQEEQFLTIRLLEERYEIERQLMHSISLGQTHKAEMLVNNMSGQWLEQRTTNPIRNLKNYTIVLNTLLRKAAEAGTVHPLHLDSLSSRYAKKIETLTSEKGAAALQHEMVHRYCLLVKNHSLKGYSLLVRKVLINIDTDITSDLTLRTQAKHLNINPSYLSTLFKKETGQTLTDFVNRRRIKHAVYLLNSSEMQIQMIAQYCGIPDVNYFTKTFKKIIGIPPKEYREKFLH